MIGGNIFGQLQKKTGTTKNEIGEHVTNWETLHTLKGFLDYSTGDSRYNNFNAKMQETTHVFICDYVEINSSIVPENSRMLINGRTYDVVLIDNPMELNKHIEILLKYTGGQNG